MRHIGTGLLSVASAVVVTLALVSTAPVWGRGVPQPAWRGHLALAVSRASRPRIAGRMPATRASALGAQGQDALAMAGVPQEPVADSASPLQPVTVEHRGRLLVLTYGPKPGAASFTGARGSAPRFVVYQGQRQIAAGRFE
jgi:hypothetical protein